MSNYELCWDQCRNLWQWGIIWKFFGACILFINRMSYIMQWNLNNQCVMFVFLNILLASDVRSHRNTTSFYKFSQLTLQTINNAIILPKPLEECVNSILVTKKQTTNTSSIWPNLHKLIQILDKGWLIFYIFKSKTKIFFKLQ